MQNKKLNKIIVAIVIFSMMAVYGSVPSAKASSLTSAKDTLSTSAPSVLANHTITFGTNVVIPNAGTIVVTLDADFGDITGASVVVCPNDASSTLATTTTSVTCSYASGLATSSSNTLTISNVQNSIVGSQSVDIETKDGATVLESANLLVAIIDTVTMSASVPATLTFAITGTSTGAIINGIAVTSTSTATTTPFGTLVVGATSSVSQALSVITNADGGYVVTVQQNQELTNAAGANINSFNNAANGTGSTTPVAWANPTGILDTDNTYGHMGLSSDDSDLGTDFTGSKFAGLNGAAAMTIMSHNGPADGTTQDMGKASVVYSTKITALQEAGDYTNTLTYICTPTY